MDHYAFVVYVMFCGPRLPGKIRRFPTLSCAEEWVSGQSFVTMFGSWAPSLCRHFGNGVSEHAPASLGEQRGLRVCEHAVLPYPHCVHIGFAENVVVITLCKT